MSELENEAHLDAADPDMSAISAAVLNDTVATLVPAEPVGLPEAVTVHDTVQAMLAPVCSSSTATGSRPGSSPSATC